MARHDIGNEERELKELFSQLDGISASEQLKTATLDAIFAKMGEESSEAAPAFAVVEGGTAGKGRTPARDARRLPSLLPRVAAIIVALMLAGGGVAYALPASHISITSGDTTVDLGVNIFGVTVDASADTAEGAELLDDLVVRGKGYEDAMELVASGLDEREQSGSSLAIHVHGGSAAQREHMDEAADRVMERRESHGGQQDVPAEKDEEPEAPETPETAPDERDAPVDDGKPAGQKGFVQEGAPQGEATGMQQELGYHADQAPDYGAMEGSDGPEGGPMPQEARP